MHSFRHNVVTSTLTLPLMSIVMLITWTIPFLTDLKLWSGLVATYFIGYLIMELNNRNALLRIRSRMMSSTFLLLMSVCPFLHSWTADFIPAICLILSYFMLFSSYQQIRPEGYVFHAYLFLGIGSIVYPPMLVLAIAYYFSMLFQLRSFTGRSLMAGLFGLLTPYWFYAAYAIWNNQLDTAFTYLYTWFKPQPPDYHLLDLSKWITMGVVFFYTIISFVHFFHTAYNDKIRTRMLFYVIATVQVFLTVGIVLMPNSFELQLRLFIANSSLLIAHYFSLGKGRFFNVWFNITLLVLFALGTFNFLWDTGKLS